MAGSMRSLRRHQKGLYSVTGQSPLQDLGLGRCRWDGKRSHSQFAHAMHTDVTLQPSASVSSVRKRALSNARREPSTNRHDDTPISLTKFRNVCRQMRFRVLHLRSQEDMMLLKTRSKNGRFLRTTYLQLVSMKSKSVEMVDSSEAHGALRRKLPAASDTEGSHRLLCGAQPPSPRCPARSSPRQAQPPPLRQRRRPSSQELGPPPKPAPASAETWSAHVTRATRPEEVSP
jgi:hypothetical protein